MEKILIVEDVGSYATDMQTKLNSLGYNHDWARSSSEALDLFYKRNKYDAIILDIALETDKNSQDNEIKKAAESNRSGVILFKKIRELRGYRRIPILVMTAYTKEVEAFFNKQECAILVGKSLSIEDLAQNLDKLLGEVDKPHQARIFIVHGHDRTRLLELKDLVQNQLNLGTPIILQEEPSLGRTILKKFVDHAREIDIALVLATPDDFPYQSVRANEPISGSESKMRARQNVVFELGYFLGMFGAIARKDACVVVMSTPEVELPSDIAGLIYVDISKGIQEAGIPLLNELKKWIKFNKLNLIGSA